MASEDACTASHFMKQRRHPTFNCKRTSNGRAHEENGCRDGKE
jgi:hypothetical protein